MSTRFVPRRAAASLDLEPFRDQWAVQLTTYRRDGKPVDTPVNVVVDGDRAYFRTFEESWKFKRLRRNPMIALAPSTPTGKPTGPAIRGTAKLLEAIDDQHAAELIDRKHPIFQRWLVRLAHRLRGLTTRHFEVRPEGG